jgi:gliding motility-associated lipoprotein GldH
MILFAGLLFCNSCTDPAVLSEQVRNLPAEGWRADSTLNFTIDIPDTSQGYDFLYLLRTELRYPYCNLFLRYTLMDSMGNVMETRLDEMMLSDPKTGELKGSGFGDIRQHVFLFLQNRKLPYAGQYGLSLKHFMRTDSLPYLLSAGIKVQKTDVPGLP